MSVLDNISRLCKEATDMLWQSEAHSYAHVWFLRVSQGGLYNELL